MKVQGETCLDAEAGKRGRRRKVTRQPLTRASSCPLWRQTGKPRKTTKKRYLCKEGGRSCVRQTRSIRRKGSGKRVSLNRKKEREAPPGGGNKGPTLSIVRRRERLYRIRAYQKKSCKKKRLRDLRYQSVERLRCERKVTMLAADEQALETYCAARGVKESITDYV